MMDKMLNKILAELQALKEGQDAVRTKIKDFGESQEVTNKLLTSETASVKNQLRDLRDDMKEFRREVRDWTRST
jgi:predicted  nucleic acid-binding Zn-ribbon protein